MKEELIYFFDTENPKQNSNPDINILGGKGYGLARMAALGIPVPAGFTISAELCRRYYANNKQLPAGFDNILAGSISRLEKIQGHKFAGLSAQPLLLSVRSGAPVSMPGMMDTLLNVGIYDGNIKHFAESSPDFAYKSYVCFLQSYARLVLKLDVGAFAQATAQEQAQKYKQLIDDADQGRSSADPFHCLKNSIIAVLDSWDGERARVYRAINNIPQHIGTAVTVQSMVFGNMDDESGTGVVFSRCPSTGKDELFGEFLPRAQGEDIVSGTKTPLPLDYMRDNLPHQHKKLYEICKKLEHHNKDMQDIEFTVEAGELYILQTRSGKRSIRAALKIAVDMQSEGVITKDRAIFQINPKDITKFLHSSVDYDALKAKPIAKGLAASPGGARGIAAFTPEQAAQYAAQGKVILVRTETSPEDIKAMNIACGILTARGGMTSHAAVVARGMGVPCVCSANIQIDDRSHTLIAGDVLIKAGENLSIDGESGKVFAGEVPLRPASFPDELKTLLSWADANSDMQVRINAETPTDIAAGLRLGGGGVGLCRTEHMYFTDTKLDLMRRMIAAQSQEQEQLAIDELLPLHIKDFDEIFNSLDGKPLNIRLLDPPLHEFLPQSAQEKDKLAANLGLTHAQLDSRLKELVEVNPMLGHRGCRLGITHPEIYKMQLEAIFKAAIGAAKEADIEIMIPFVSDAKELEILLSMAKKIKCEIDKESKLKVKFGTMIELPRAAMSAGEIAPLVDFFSFGTNDLTQTCYGLSRDDAGKFMPRYIAEGIMQNDPFVEIDQKGVGALIKMAIKAARAANPKIKLGVCGEHAGDPSSIEFFSRAGIDYISCSPYRVPVARLASAQSALHKK